MDGFIPINRKLFEHYLWTENRKLSRFEAWLDILQMVSYIDDNSQMISGILCKWKRGQYPISISFLCTRWKWSEKPLRNFLKLLEKDKMITLKRSSKWTMLSVCNYDTYNIKGQSEGVSKGNQEAIKGQQLNKDNKEKEDIILELSTADTWKISQARIHNTTVEKINQYIEAYTEMLEYPKTISDVKFGFNKWMKGEKTTMQIKNKRVAL